MGGRTDRLLRLGFLDLVGMGWMGDEDGGKV